MDKKTVLSAQSQSRCLGHARSRASQWRLEGHFGPQSYSGKVRNRDGAVRSFRNLLPRFDGAGGRS